MGVVRMSVEMDDEKSVNGEVSHKCCNMYGRPANETVGLLPHPDCIRIRIIRVQNRVAVGSVPLIFRTSGGLREGLWKAN